jgi:26S proteasome regulatory subunit N13
MNGISATGPSEEAATAVQNLLRSLEGNQALTNQTQQSQARVFTTLPDLLPSSTTIPVIDSANASTIDDLLTHIPPILLLLSLKADRLSSVDPNSEDGKAAIEALSLDQKKEVLQKVLRSPQFSQSLASLTAALHSGGLPTISEALRIPVKDRGYIKKGGNVPLGNGDAMEAFVNGVKEYAEKENDADERKMETE